MINDIKVIVELFEPDEKTHFWENCGCSDQVQESEDPEKCKCKVNKNHAYRSILRLKEIVKTGEIKPYAVNFSTAHNMGFQDDWHYFMDEAKAKAYLEEQLKELKEVLKDEEDGAYVEYVTPDNKKSVWRDNGEGELEEY